ncbi:HC-toxin efflux carrier TOXA [Penicillium angulare]|uniref:HC-toxin efflux carrier TOXA n=1 Tax=Penicillium angulare TaxID=116970 RepID=A0A9W9FAT0_9EURO|nr:HC-toxin efflux carrier TOXA [Penicillium angulare]
MMRCTTLRRLLAVDDSSPPSTDDDIESPNEIEKGSEASLDMETQPEYPSSRTVILSMVSVCMAFFLSALDRTIVGVAIPAISDEFKSFDDIAWYESAFLFAFCISQFPVGKIYTYFSAKWTMMILTAIFEIGSVVCAAAPSSLAFIIGRALTGLGGSGSVVGASVVIVNLVPLEKRPKYQGFLGAMFGLSSIIGPLVGGVFASKVTWRWCFWINVPIGGLALMGLWIFMPNFKGPDVLKGSLKKKLSVFDPIGNALFTAGIICLLLALQWGGLTYAWSSPRIISLLVVGIVLLVAFSFTQWYQEDGTVPPRIFCQRSIAAGFFVSLGLGAALILPTFYLPIWFQAIKETTAIEAGIRILPLLLGTVIAVIAAGIIISKTGYYTPWLLVGCAIRIVGGGLMTLFRVDTSTGEWIGYQLIVGIGTGMTLQQTNIAVQTVLSNKEIPLGLTIMSFGQFLAGTISVSVSQTILTNTLTTQLAQKLPDFDPSILSSTGATQLQEFVPMNQLSTVMTAYNAGIVNIFYLTLAAACSAFVASLFMEWKSVKAKR